MGSLIMAQIDFNGEVITKTYTRYADYYKDTFCPDNETLWVTDFKIRGFDYARKKAYAEDIGINFSYARSTWYPSWGEFAEVTSKLENIAKKYGLVTEFHENGLI